MAAVRTNDYTAPWRETPQVWELFSDENDLLCELQKEWRTALAGAVYVAIDSGDGDLQQDVTRAFTEVRDRQLAARRILEANSEHPAIVAAMRKERALLSCFFQELVTEAQAESHAPAPNGATQAA